MADKTEAPSGRRIEKAREEGQVARSVELNTAAIMLVGMLLLQGPGKSLIDSFKTLILQAILTAPKADLTPQWLSTTYINDLTLVAPGLLIVLSGLLVVGSVVTLVQTGFLWSTKKLGFHFDRMNPLTNLKRIFSGQGLIELGRALLKLTVVGWVAYSYLQENMSKLMQLSQMDLGNGISTWAELGFALSIRVGSIYLVLAIADYIYQRWHYMNGLKMTKEEVKEEYKEQEGNPFIKGRIRQQMRKLARMRMMSNVPKANVVITNPTHLAVAIQYDHASMAAPKLVAKGASLVALRIRGIAEEHGIPVIENIPLARAIYKTVDIDQEIPPELYAAMAEILVYVYHLKGQKPVFAGSPQ
jgi:flagellar biosynthesis protein FlhB